MGITQTATRVRVESPAKNGTLGSQSGAGSKQIILDSNISTNNGNLESSPSLVKRFIGVNHGGGDLEVNAIVSVEADGVTCNCFDEWETQPASGSAYYVSYVMRDVVTIDGCSKETSTGHYVFSKRLVIGNGTNLAYLGLGNYQTLRFVDSTAASDALRITNNGYLHVGTIKNNVPTQGATLIFTNDGDGEGVITLQTGGELKIYDSVIEASFAEDGVTLAYTKEANSTLDWRKVKVLGFGGAIQTRYEQLKDWDQAEFLTVADIKASPMWEGWLKSAYDQSLYNAVLSEANGCRVTIMVEDP